MVISLFAKCRDYMINSIGRKDIQHLGINVINDCNDKVINDQIIVNKANEKHILFIGGWKYKSCADNLIDVYSILRKKYPGLVLDIVGIKGTTGEKICGVNYYGYLDKSNEETRKLYYQLLEKATVFVNTTPLWAGYSSTIEAMFYYTPVCVSKYEDFVEEFGDFLTFGYYSENIVSDIVTKITSIFENNYEELARNAHTAVHNYTWSNFVELFLEKAQRLINR